MNKDLAYIFICNVMLTKKKHNFRKYFDIVCVDIKKFSNNLQLLEIEYS